MDLEWVIWFILLYWDSRKLHLLQGKFENFIFRKINWKEKNLILDGKKKNITNFSFKNIKRKLKLNLSMNILKDRTHNQQWDRESRFRIKHSESQKHSKFFNKKSIYERYRLNSAGRSNNKDPWVNQKYNLKKLVHRNNHWEKNENLKNFKNIKIKQWNTSAISPLKTNSLTKIGVQNESWGQQILQKTPKINKGLIVGHYFDLIWFRRENGNWRRDLFRYSFLYSLPFSDFNNEDFSQ